MQKNYYARRLQVVLKQMTAKKQKRNKSKQGLGQDRGETVEEPHSEEENYEDNGNADEEEANVSPLMQSIINKIPALRSDIKSEMSEFRFSLHDDMRKELTRLEEKSIEDSRKLQVNYRLPQQEWWKPNSTYPILKNGTRQ